MTFYIGYYAKNNALVTDGNPSPSLHITNSLPIVSKDQLWKECNLIKVLDICEKNKIYSLWMFCKKDKNWKRTQYFTYQLSIFKILKEFHEKQV